MGVGETTGLEGLFAGTVGAELGVGDGTVWIGVRAFGTTSNGGEMTGAGVGAI